MVSIILGLLVFSGILLLVLGLTSSGGSAGISARLERYAAGKNEATATAGTAQPSPGIGELLGQSVALARLNRVVEQRDFGASLARDIARADLKLKPGEFIAMWAMTVVTVPFIFFVLGVVSDAAEESHRSPRGSRRGLLPATDVAGSPPRRAS